MSGTKPAKQADKPFRIARDYRGTRIYLVSVHQHRGMRWHTDKTQAMMLPFIDAAALIDRASKEWGAKCAIVDKRGNIAMSDQALHIQDVIACADLPLAAFDAPAVTLAYKPYKPCSDRASLMQAKAGRSNWGRR